MAMVKLTILCQLNGGCMGCCGHDFESKQKIEEAIKKNTLEFNQLKEELIKFRDRTHPSDLRSGVCRNLIQENGKIFCPLHPALNKTDLREKHCDINYFCKTAKEFEKWDQKKQEAFIRFIKKKNLDNITYSIKMDDNTLLKEFKTLLTS